MGLGRPHDITAAAHSVPTSAGRARSRVRSVWFRVRVRFGVRVRVRVRVWAPRLQSKVHDLVA